MSEEPARLITEAGACYLRARRYRLIAAECERWLTTALTIGGRLRAQARFTSGEVSADPDVIRELHRVIGELEAAIAHVHESDLYQRAVRAWQEGSFGDVAALAPEIFEGVVPQPRPPLLYVPVEVGGRGAGDGHFASPTVVAERVIELLHGGIPVAQPAPDLGADDHIGSIVFDDDPDASGSPVTIVVAPGDLGLPVFRLEPSGTLLVYARHVRVAASVRCAAQVSDEWWAIRPDAYAGFTAELSRELSARGVPGIQRA